MVLWHDIHNTNYERRHFLKLMQKYLRAIKHEYVVLSSRIFHVTSLYNESEIFYSEIKPNTDFGTKMYFFILNLLIIMTAHALVYMML